MPEADEGHLRWAIRRKLAIAALFGWRIARAAGRTIAERTIEMSLIFSKRIDFFAKSAANSCGSASYADNFDVPRFSRMARFGTMGNPGDLYAVFAQPE